MADEAQVSLVQRGADVWNEWRARSTQPIDLSGADLSQCGIIRANLKDADLRGVNLSGTQAVYADLRGACLAEAYFTPANLQGTNLRNAVFDTDTDLSGILLDNHTCLGDIRWNDVNLSVVNWDQMNRLGDEDRQKAFPDIAARAYRQVAAQLRSQGMHEHADRFAYRARLCRRRSLLKQKKISTWLWSLFLDGLAGYGYYPARVFRIYLIVLAIFTLAYYLAAQAIHVPMSALSALIFSITAFHGRGFFPGVSGIGLDSPLVVLAAAEAITGLFIEASFIATFTDRYFGDR